MQGSLQKQPASTAEERRLVFNNASRSGKILLSSSLQLLMPMVQLGGLASDHNFLPRVPLIEWDKNEKGARPSLP